MSGSRWSFVMAAVLTLGTACSQDPTGGSPARTGTLTLRLTTPRTDDGAVRFEVSGPPIDSATAADLSLQLFTRRADGSTMAGVVVGDVAGGALVTLQVPDVGAVAGYTARVLEVADRRNALRGSLTGYAITVTR